MWDCPIKYSEINHQKKCHLSNFWALGCCSGLMCQSTTAAIQSFEIESLHRRLILSNGKRLTGIDEAASFLTSGGPCMRDKSLYRLFTIVQHREGVGQLISMFMTMVQLVRQTPWSKLSCKSDHILRNEIVLIDNHVKNRLVVYLELEHVMKSFYVWIALNITVAEVKDDRKNLRVLCCTAEQEAE